MCSLYLFFQSLFMNHLHQFKNNPVTEIKSYMHPSVGSKMFSFYRLTQYNHLLQKITSTLLTVPVFIQQGQQWWNIRWPFFCWFFLIRSDIEENLNFSAESQSYEKVLHLRELSLTVLGRYVVTFLPTFTSSQPTFI